MKTVFCLLLALAASLAVPTKKDVPADHEFLVKQREILKLLFRAHEPNISEDQVDIAAKFDIEANLDKFKEVDSVKELYELYVKKQLLHRGEIFNTFEDKHLEQAILLIETLLSANSWDTLYRTACWARDKVNEGQFVYALSVTVMHSDFLRGIILPPPYEIYPHLFVNSEVIHEAYSAKMRHHPVVIPMNFTGTIRNPEQRVAYFGEDIGLNTHHHYWHMNFPFWWSPHYDTKFDRAGEMFWYMHHQLVARYDLERLSNYLPEVEPLEWFKPIKSGFAPLTMYRKGGEFPNRPDNMLLHDLHDLKVHDVVVFEERIKEAIDRGFVYNKWIGEKIRLNNSIEGIETLGRMIEASRLSPDIDYYGSIHNLGHILLGEIMDPDHKFNLPPGVMEHFETAMRDPVFFSLHKHIDYIFKHYKDTLVPYKREELDFPGVKVENVEVDRLVTFFEPFDIDLYNALDDDKTVSDIEIKARVQRINHKPFTYHINVESDVERKVVVRTFIGPKYDWYHQEVPVNEKRWEMVELDKFLTHIPAGKSVIERLSTESTVTTPDYESFRSLVNRVDEALKGNKEFIIDEEFRHCGLPDRLLIPKGNEEGYPVKFFVIVTDWEEDKVNQEVENHRYGNVYSYCGTYGDRLYPDKKAFLYPFDRVIKDVNVFKTPNMFGKYVSIYHKDISELNRVVPVVEE
uniref:Hemocyanin subunit type 1 n=1 Tax=Machilis germanica TaxID=568273 RepID=B9W4M8_9INSE|nr:hemocyanin subunit type 1 precursor [Machilis germanica]